MEEWLVVEENWRGEPDKGRVRASLASGPVALDYAWVLTETEDGDFTIGTYADYARDHIKLVI